MEEPEIPRLDLHSLQVGISAFRTIVHNLKQVVWIQDSASDQVLYISPSFETVWGLPCESFYSDPLTLIQSIHPEDRIKVMSFIPDESRKSTDLLYRIQRPDGSPRWISAYPFQIQDVSSSHSYQVWVAEDITEQKQVDQTLRKALDRSREQFTLSRRMSLARKPEVVLKTLMSASELRPATNAFVLFFEPARNGASRVSEMIAAWSSEAPLASAIPNESINEANLLEELTALDLFHPARPVIVSDIERDQRLPPLVRDLLLEGHIRTVASFPLVALGNWLGSLVVFFAVEKHFEPLELRHIKVLADQATITLNNLQLLEIEAESRHEAERANEIKTEFLAMITHELRTPLTSIVGFTTTLLAKDVVWEADEQRDFIQTIHQEADRLQELINHLLDLSRLEAGMLPINRASHTLNEILVDALSQFHVLTSEHPLTLHLPANQPAIEVDSKRIAQVLVNLVRNAAMYAPKGTEINISARVRGDYLQINVSDQGPGIAPADHKRVFKAFQRGEKVENGSVQGAGLGLAICKGLVEAHGGRIWIRKKNTPGATISFTVPLDSGRTSAQPVQKE